MLTLVEDIFAGRKFCEFRPNSQKYISFLTAQNVDTRKLTPVKFFQIAIRKNQFPQNFSRINEMRILEFLSDTVSFKLGFL